MDDITYSVMVYNNLDDDQTFWESFESLDDAFEWSYNLIGDKFKNKNMSLFTEYKPVEEEDEVHWISNSDDGEWAIEIQPEVLTFEDEDEDDGIDFYSI